MKIRKAIRIINAMIGMKRCDIFAIEHRKCKDENKLAQKKLAQKLLNEDIAALLLAKDALKEGFDFDKVFDR